MPDDIQPNYALHGTSYVIWLSLMFVCCSIQAIRSLMQSCQYLERQPIIAASFSLNCLVGLYTYTDATPHMQRSQRILHFGANVIQFHPNGNVLQNMNWQQISARHLLSTINVLYTSTQQSERERERERLAAFAMLHTTLRFDTVLAFSTTFSRSGRIAHNW